MLYGLLLAISFATCTIVQSMEIGQKNLFVPSGLGDVKVVYKENNFFVNDMPVERYNIDKELRKMDTREKLARALVADSYISVKEIGDKEYRLDFNGRIKGGGVFGATVGAFLGKAAVSVIGHGAIFLIGGLTGPAAPATILALESVFGAAIESASMAGAVAGGMALGVATGPV